MANDNGFYLGRGSKISIVYRVLFGSVLWITCSTSSIVCRCIVYRVLLASSIMCRSIVYRVPLCVWNARLARLS